jgi:hypothetical protein
MEPYRKKNSQDQEFDWVRAPAKCDPDSVFQELVGRIRRDVESMSSLGRPWLSFSMTLPRDGT